MHESSLVRSHRSHTANRTRVELSQGNGVQSVPSCFRDSDVLRAVTSLLVRLACWPSAHVLARFYQPEKLGLILSLNASSTSCTSAMHDITQLCGMCITERGEREREREREFRGRDLLRSRCVRI